MQRFLSHALAVGALLLGCGPERRPHPGELVYESARLEVYVDEKLELCGGSVPYMESFLDDVEARYGLAPEERIAYHLTPDPSAFCMRDVAACALDSFIYAKDAPSTHELAHAIRSHVASSPIEEGFAEMLGTGLGPLGGGERRNGDSVAAVQFEGDTLGGDLYGSAARFMQAVEQDFGVALVLELLERTGPSTSFDEFSVLFAELAQTDIIAYAEALDATVCSGAGNSWVLPACSSAAAHQLGESGETPLVWIADSNCTSPDAIGEWLGGYWIERVVEIPEVEFNFGYLRIEQTETVDEAVEITADRCGSCDEWQHNPWEFDYFTESEQVAEPGRWVIRLYAPLDVDIQGELVVRYDPAFP